NISESYDLFDPRINLPQLNWRRTLFKDYETWSSGPGQRQLAMPIGLQGM
ncbi:unnamed protein product, partial [marine sediment metagenome]